MVNSWAPVNNYYCKQILKNQRFRFYILTGGPDTTTTAVPHGTNDTGTKAIVPSTTTNEQSSTTESKGMLHNDAIPAVIIPMTFIVLH